MAGAGASTSSETAKVAVDVGGQHTCAVRDGQAWCWGLSAYGEIGNGTVGDLENGTVEQSSVPVPVTGLEGEVLEVSAGFYITCAIKSGGVWCWGRNTSGELGNGTTTDSAVPVPVMGLQSGVSSVTAGSGFACAIQGGRVLCWGAKLYRVSGPESPQDYTAAPIEVLGPWGGDTVTQIKAGGSGVCAVTEHSAVWCWNYGPSGDAIRGPLSIQGGVRKLAVGGWGACTLSDRGEVRCWLGDPEVGKSNIEGRAYFDAGSDVTDVAVGQYHACVVKQGRALCWGDNREGVGLGIPGITSTSTPTVVPGLEGVTQVSARSVHTCAVVSGDIRCWGINSAGDLGGGTTSNSAIPVRVVFPR